MQERQFNIATGSPGAGKSSFVAKYVKAYSENAIVYKHIANLDDKAFSFLTAKTKENWRQGIAPGAKAKCKFAGKQDEYKDFLKWVIGGGLRNGLLCIDDATIFERDRLSKEMNELVTMRRHYGLDIFLVYHGLSLLPIEQFIFCNHIIIFNTNDNIQYKANKLPCFEDLKKAISEARENFKSNDAKNKYRPAIVKLA